MQVITVEFKECLSSTYYISCWGWRNRKRLGGVWLVGVDWVSVWLPSGGQWLWAWPSARAQKEWAKAESLPGRQKYPGCWGPWLCLPHQLPGWGLGRGAPAGLPSWLSQTVSSTLDRRGCTSSWKDRAGLWTFLQDPSVAPGGLAGLSDGGGY